ncbi:hypothetical protein ASPWEDRAFT_179733 [Aspergillus wentii DTO 134E9]|uniref:Uncharacterized protein n=1 Tax=Aspergillus wentii DTO 134E9 TaxID=1073089 RepID=A0A1L9RT44_ASPWE|nr:uncharacterized protein ASPWEDRAFT_179733 [Aspergillus wentii DTO 134E9]OJJ38136.1 hypothetical protein ASPWEDRAFT_179733 [Aspergillus wentii DTO 134E9]
MGRLSICRACFRVCTVSEFLVGVSTNTPRQYRDPKSQAFVDAFDFAQRCQIDRAWMGAPLPLYYNPKLESAVFLHELAKQTQDPAELRDQILCVLLAGRDITASLLSNVFYQLSRRKDILSRLRGKIAKLDGIRHSYVQLKQMKYPHAFINEDDYPQDLQDIAPAKMIPLWEQKLPDMASGFAGFTALLIMLNPQTPSMTSGYSGSESVIYLETPLNSTGNALNISEYAEKAHSRGVLYRWTPSLASPHLEDQFACGVDICIRGGRRIHLGSVMGVWRDGWG